MYIHVYIHNYDILVIIWFSYSLLINEQKGKIYSAVNMFKKCAFRDKSMKFCTQLREVIRFLAIRTLQICLWEKNANRFFKMAATSYQLHCRNTFDMVFHNVVYQLILKSLLRKRGISISVQYTTKAKSSALQRSFLTFAASSAALLASKPY